VIYIQKSGGSWYDSDVTDQPTRFLLSFSLRRWAQASSELERKRCEELRGEGEEIRRKAILATSMHSMPRIIISLR